MIDHIVKATQLLPNHKFQIAVNLPGFYYVFCESFAAYDDFLIELHEIASDAKTHSVRNYKQHYYAILIEKEL